MTKDEWLKKFLANNNLELSIADIMTPGRLREEATEQAVAFCEAKDADGNPANPGCPEPDWFVRVLVKTIKDAIATV